MSATTSCTVLIFVSNVSNAAQCPSDTAKSRLVLILSFACSYYFPRSRRRTILSQMMSSFSSSSRMSASSAPDWRNRISKFRAITPTSDTIIKSFTLHSSLPFHRTRAFPVNPRLINQFPCTHPRGPSCIHSVVLSVRRETGT